MSSKGDIRVFGPGDCLLMEDTAGKGHGARPLSGEASALMIALEQTEAVVAGIGEISDLVSFHGFENGGEIGPVVGDYRSDQSPQRRLEQIKRSTRGIAHGSQLFQPRRGTS